MAPSRVRPPAQPKEPVTSGALYRSFLPVILPVFTRNLAILRALQGPVQGRQPGNGP